MDNFDINSKALNYVRSNKDANLNDTQKKLEAFENWNYDYERGKKTLDVSNGIDKNDLSLFITQASGNVYDDTETSSLFDILDTDGDGMLTENELEMFGVKDGQITGFSLYNKLKKFTSEDIDYSEREKTLSRSDLKDLGNTVGKDDGFAEFLKTKNLDIDTASRSQLQSALNEYNQIRSDNSEFNALYDLILSNDSLKSELTKQRSIYDSSEADFKASFEDLFNLIKDKGAFDEDATYNQNVKDRIPDAIAQMKSLIENADISASMKSQYMQITDFHEVYGVSYTVVE